MRRSTPAVILSAAFAVSVAHQGAASVTGVVRDGATPICNASVTLYRAGTSGYGSGATTCGSTTSDTAGSFSITPTCSPPASAEMYVVAAGGSVNTGGCGAVASSPIGLAAAVGQFSSVASRSYVVNELTTVASVWSLAQFLNPADPTTIGAPAGNGTGIRNAAATVANLANVSNGQLSVTLPAAGVCMPNSPDPNCPAEQRLVTLANALAACVAAGVPSSKCTNLFASATPPGGSAPTDTLQAAADVALHPVTVNVAGVFNVAVGNTPYSPSLSSAPTDWAIALNFSGGGMDFPFAVEVDGFGNVWLTNSGQQYPGGRHCGSVTKLSPTGQPLSGPNGYTGGGILTPQFIAIDTNNRVWVTNSGYPFNGSAPSGCPSPYGAGSYWGSVTVLDQSGSPVGNTPLSAGVFWPMGLAIDGSNNAWLVNNPDPYPNGAHPFDSRQLIEMDASGNVLTSASGGGLSFSIIPAIDRFQNVWVANCGSGSIPAFPYYCDFQYRAGTGIASAFTGAGTPISPSSGYNDGGTLQFSGDGIAIDSHGRIWVAISFSTQSPPGAALLCGTDASGCGGRQTGDAIASFSGSDLEFPDNVIVDGGDNAWFSDCGVDCCPPNSCQFSGPGNVVAIAPSGARISPPAGFTGSGLNNPSGDAVDASGNVWVSNGYSDPSVNGGLGSVTEFIGLGVPATLPLGPPRGGEPVSTGNFSLAVNFPSFSGSFTYDNVAFTAFGTPVNFGDPNSSTFVGTMSFTGQIMNFNGTTQTGDFTAHFDSNAGGLFSFDETGNFICDPAGCSSGRPASFVGKLLTGSIHGTVADELPPGLTYAFEGTDVFVGSSGSVLNFSGNSATNAFAPAPTPAGSNVLVPAVITFTDSMTAKQVTLAVDITYANVSSGGNTLVTAVSNAAGQLASNLRLPALPGLSTAFFDVSTSAAVSGPISVCEHYTPDSTNTFLAGTTIRLSDLRLLHFESCPDQPGPSDPKFCDRTTKGAPNPSNEVCGTVTSLSPFVLAVAADSDNDGIADSIDACPTTPGLPDRQGCPVGTASGVELHVVDQAKSGACPGGAGSCESPIAGAAVRVFDRNNAAFQAAYGTRNPSGSIYDRVFDNDIGRVGACSTDATGHCTAGETVTGDYLVIAKYVDSATSKTVYTGRPEGTTDFVDTNGDGLRDLATQDFQVIEVIKRDGTVQFSGGSKTVVRGSYLEIVYPDFAIWESAAAGFVYPFILTSDSNWSVDVCAQVPAGYQIVGVYDADGNLLSTANCVQTFVADETRVVAFSVVDTGSPRPRLLARLRVHGGHAAARRFLRLRVDGGRAYHGRR